MTASSPAPDADALADERAAFEAAMAAEGYQILPTRYRDGPYRSQEYAAGWAMWQAARLAQPAPSEAQPCEVCAQRSVAAMNALEDPQNAIAVQPAPDAQSAPVDHRQGCEALGGYGHGVGECTCGASKGTP